MKIIVGGKEKGLMALASESFFKTGGQPATTDDTMQKLLKQIYTQAEFETYFQ